MVCLLFKDFLPEPLFRLLTPAAALARDENNEHRSLLIRLDMEDELGGASTSSLFTLSLLLHISRSRTLSPSVATPIRANSSSDEA